ncbi:MAG TPA: hypothetical protein PKY50_02410 [Candidatus Competibacter sp.]|nr:hypothetical protein [Candidatus Competibacter sp.]
MKVNVSVEATAQEMREFLGLPNVQPLHDDVLRVLRDNVQRGVINFEALSAFKPLLPTQFHSMEMVQKFWEAIAKASGSTKDKMDKKPDGTTELRDNDAVQNGSEKSS